MNLDSVGVGPERNRPLHLAQTNLLPPADQTKLAEARRLINEVREDLDTSASECDHCGLIKAHDWDAKQLDERLKAMSKSLRKLLDDVERRDS